MMMVAMYCWREVGCELRGGKVSGMNGARYELNMGSLKYMRAKCD